MNKKEILGWCEFLKLHGYENTDNISKFIFGLQQENKKLNGAIQTYDILLKSNIEENQQLKIQISAREEEYKKLEDNWNKLKEYLHNVDVVIDYSENYDGRFINYDELIDKMQELEGSDRNENNWFIK